MSKKKKVIMLVGMVALLGLTWGLNILINGQSLSPSGGNVVYGNFFATYRADRIETRNQTMLYLDSIINNSASSDSAKTDAEASKLALTKFMEQELILENLIKALGFEDAIVTNTTENLNVIIKAKELEATQVAQVLEIITTETNREATAVRVLPVE